MAALEKLLKVTGAIPVLLGALDTLPVDDDMGDVVTVREVVEGDSVGEVVDVARAIQDSKNLWSVSLKN